MQPQLSIQHVGKNQFSLRCDQVLPHKTISHQLLICAYYIWERIRLKYIEANRVSVCAYMGTYKNTNASVPALRRSCRVAFYSMVRCRERHLVSTLHKDVFNVYSEDQVLLNTRTQMKQHYSYNTLKHVIEIKVNVKSRTMNKSLRIKFKIPIVSPDPSKTIIHTYTHLFSHEIFILKSFCNV